MSKLSNRGDRRASKKDEAKRERLRRPNPLLAQDANPQSPSATARGLDSTFGALPDLQVPDRDEWDS